MQAALVEARKADQKDEVPVGAVAVLNGKIIARAHNIRESTQDPLGHAELLLLRKAAKKVGSWRMPQVEVYVTLEPCLMCLEAMRQARISKIIYNDHDPKSEPIILLKNFFKKLRKKRM